MTDISRLPWKKSKIGTFVTAHPTPDNHRDSASIHKVSGRPKGAREWLWNVSRGNNGFLNGEAFSRQEAADAATVAWHALSDDG